MNENELIKSLKSNGSLEGITGNDIKKLLIYVNSKVRGIDVKSNDIYSGTMYAGDLISPNNDIQNRYFNKIVELLNNVNNNRYKATLLHYLINELHLFVDGNGRTARCTYEILANPEFSFENSETFSHKQHGQFDTAVVSTDEFENRNNLKNINIALSYPSFLVYQLLVDQGLIAKNSSETIIGGTTDAEVNEINHDNIYISDEIREQLSEQEIQSINLALGDNNASEVFTTSALTMNILNGNISNLSEVMDGYHTREYIVTSSDSQSKTTFKSWTKEDYMRSITIANILKETLFDAMVDIFEKPENFKASNGYTLAEILSNNIGGSELFPLEETIGMLVDGSFDFTDTRIQSGIEQINQLLKMPPRTFDVLQSAIEATEPTVYERGITKQKQIIVDENSVDKATENEKIQE